MVSIWDLEGLSELESSIIQAWEFAREFVIDNTPRERNDLERFSINKITIWGAWANDRGGPNEIIQVRVFINVEGVEDETQKPNFDGVATDITDIAQDIISSRDEELYEDVGINIPEVFFEESAGFNLEAQAMSRFPEQTIIDLQDVRVQQQGRVFDLTRKVAIELRSGTNFGNLPRIPLFELRDDEPAQQVQPELEEPEEEEPEEEEPEEEEPEFPSLPEPIRRFAVSEEELEVKAGQKDTKRVKFRSMYPFEVIQATGVLNPPRLPYNAAGAGIGRNDIFDGVGEAERLGWRGERIPGSGEREKVTPATFPSIGVYLRNYLKFQGPVYPLKLYNEMLVYLAYVNGYHNFDLRIGSYNSTRRYFHRLNQLPEYGGPKLVNKLNQNQAAQRGLKTVPDHPSVEGETAPWLQRRQWYELVEENEDNEVWFNVTDTLERLKSE